MSDEAKSEAPLTREFLLDHAERLDPGIRQHYGDEWAEAFARNSLEAERVREQIEAARPNGLGVALMRIIGYGGGGGGSGGNSHHAVATGTNGQGGAGGQVYTCRCGKVATGFTGALYECSSCREARCGGPGAFADAVKALVDAGRASAAESMRELQSQGYAWESAPPQPECRYCACGQELRTPRAQGRRICGDCFSELRAGTRMSDARPLDARIAAAKSADLDPTSEWGAGATPGYDWEGR